MKFIKTEISDLFIFEPNLFSDNRGYFFESYNQQIFKNQGINIKFIQDNHSYSKYGTIRGLHFQTGKDVQSKLVRAVKGKILDIAVDLRKYSNTFGKWKAVELSETNHRQLFIPKGFAHGFSVLSEEAIVLYKCDSFYQKESEDGILFNDIDLKIDWKIPKHKQLLSNKDKALKTFQEYTMNPCF